MSHIGDDVSEVIEFVPSHFLVQRHERAKYACQTCKAGVKTAPGPDKVFERSLCGPGLMAHVLVSKYADHLPLHRQSRIYARDNVELSPSTLCDWVGRGAELLEPLAQRIWDNVLSAYLLQTDATGLKVLDPQMARHRIVLSRDHDSSFPQRRRL